MTPVASARREKVNTADFDICMAVSRRHNTSIAKVKTCYDDFVVLDSDKDGLLNPEEFEVLVRRSSGVGEGIPTPSALFDRLWQALDPLDRGFADFDDFFMWSRDNTFCEIASNKDGVSAIMSRMTKR